jgi:hypothetical protein
VQAGYNESTNEFHLPASFVCHQKLMLARPGSVHNLRIGYWSTRPTPVSSVYVIYELDNSSDNADMSNEKEINNCSPKAYGI